MLKGRFERLALKGVLWCVAVLLAAFLVFMAGSVWEVYHKERLAWQERENARELLSDVSLRYDALTQSVENFSSERGMEEEFRKRFPVAREGEEVIVLVDAPQKDENLPPEKPKGVWGVVRGWFGF